MKKILFATTALVAAAGVYGSANAEGPKVTLGGFTNFQAGYVDEDRDTFTLLNATTGVGNAGDRISTREYGFRNDTEITVNIEGKTDAGLGYGAVVSLEADVTNDADNEGTNASRTYIYLQGESFGRVELGSNAGAETTMRVDASTIARGTGGIDGDFNYFLNNTFLVDQGNAFLINPKLPAEYGPGVTGDESTGNANKITYYSPRFSGVQVGLSYIPDDGERGQTLNRLENNNNGGSNAFTTNFEDGFAAAVNYQNKFGDVGVNAAVTGLIASAEANNVEDIKAYSVGAAVTYQGFSFAASYIDYDDSGKLNSDNGSTDGFTVGAAYETGPFGVSLTYLDTTLELSGSDHDFSNLVLSADYKLAEGLTPYAELAFYDFDAAGTAGDDEGTVFLVGTELAF